MKMDMKKYKINEHGVCENPSTETVFNDGRFIAKIHLAENESNWAFGYDFQIKGAGTGCFHSGALPGFNKYRTKFATPEEARKVAIEIGIEDFRRASSWHDVSKVLSALNEALTPQLSLF
jgi:hypothetical protein